MTGYSVEGTEKGTIDVQWTPPSDLIQGYMLWYTAASSSEVVTLELGNEEPPYRLSGLLNFTTYTVCLSVLCDNGVEGPAMSESAVTVATGKATCGILLA